MFGEYRSLPAEARLLVYLNFAPGIALGLIYTDLSYFLTSVQGLSSAFMGTVISVMGLTTVAVSLPVGILADRFGRRRFLIIGNLLASATLVLFALTTNPVLLIGAALVEGTTEAAFAAAGGALLTETAGDAGRTAAFSFSSFLSNLAFGLGGFVLPLIIVLESFGLTSLQSHIALYFAVAAASIATTPFLLRVHESRRSDKAKTIREFLPRKSKAVLVRYGSASVLIALGAGLFVPLMGQWFSRAYGVADTLSGPVLGVSGFLIALTTLAAPRLARRFGLVRALVMTQGSSTVFMFLVPFSPTFAVAGAIYIVRSFLMNVSNPLSTSLLMGLVSPDERGAASGLTAALWKFPNSISAVIGAGLIGAGLLALPFFLATALYLASIALFWFFFRKTTLPEEVASRAA